jgi:non-specific serine/threonine protein kinase
MGPRHHAVPLANRASRPRWSEVLRAVREARGSTVEGWGARLGVSGRTVLRWERGERTPDPGAEAALLAACRELGLFRLYDRGPLAGLHLTAEVLQELLAEARWRVRSASADVAPSTAQPSSSLPVHLTTFIGRERELAAVRRVQAGTRLLTLTGAGGCGKTRLALELAGELLWAYPQGVWWVDLAPLPSTGPAGGSPQTFQNQALLPHAVASALAIRATGQQSVTEALIDALRERHLLLLLDNCEHLLPDCAELVEVLLRACLHLEVVATSRGSLGIGGETVWRVPPLSLPSRPDDVADADAVRLFVARAQLQRPDFTLTPDIAAAVAQICRQLDGLPLAIELAAARVGVLSVGQIADRLADRFRLLTSGSRTALPRHRTLGAALDWSYELLTEPERAVLRALSVFAGGCTLEAAEIVCGEGNGQRATGNEAGTGPPLVARCSLPVARDDVLDLLARLVDKSLVIAEEYGKEVRYRLLETVRQYAGERLTASGEAHATQARHAVWCLVLAEAAENEMYGPREPEAGARLEREHDNLRAALAWSLAEGRQGEERGLRLAGALARFWDLRGHVSEGRQWLSRLLAAGKAATIVRAKALRGLGNFAYIQGDFAAASASFEECLRLCRKLGDESGVAQSEVFLGKIAYTRGEYALARTFLEASLARCAGQRERPVIATAQTFLGMIALRQGDYNRSRTLLDASLAIQRELGNQHGIAGNLNVLATLAGEEGDDERQAAALEECLALNRELDNKRGIAQALGDYGMRAWLRREYDRAAALLEEALALYREEGERQGMARIFGYQSLAALYARDYDRATALNRECLTLYRTAGEVFGVGRYLPVLAGVLFGQGQPERAARLFAAAAALRERLGVQLPLAMRSAHDRAVASVCAALGDADFMAAWAAGQALSMDEAVDEALAAPA